MKSHFSAGDWKQAAAGADGLRAVVGKCKAVASERRVA